MRACHRPTGGRGVRSPAQIAVAMEREPLGRTGVRIGLTSSSVHAAKHMTVTTDARLLARLRADEPVERHHPFRPASAPFTRRRVQDSLQLRLPRLAPEPQLVGRAPAHAVDPALPILRPLCADPVRRTVLEGAIKPPAPDALSGLGAVGRSLGAVASEAL